MNDDRPHRNTLVCETAAVVLHEHHAGDQHVLRLSAPRCAARALPGQFVHLSCHTLLPMRRPLSLQRANSREGTIDLLYKVVGTGTGLLAQAMPGETLDLIGPIGVPFRRSPGRTRPLLIGGGVGIPPMIFLAETLRAVAGCVPLVLMGSEVPFPFAPEPSRILVPGMPDGVIAAMPLMEEWGIASRLASTQGFAGCHEGFVTELARAWLASLDERSRDLVEVFACGPHPMLEAVARLTREVGVPCQVSLEEYMACAVGGCAGCAVRVMTDAGPAMKRVCVDGPVFDARCVF